MSDSTMISNFQGKTYFFKMSISSFSSSIVNPFSLTCSVPVVSSNDCSTSSSIPFRFRWYSERLMKSLSAILMRQSTTLYSEPSTISLPVNSDFPNPNFFSPDVSIVPSCSLHNEYPSELPHLDFP